MTLNPKFMPQNHPTWTQTNNSLQKTYEFKGFPDAIHFMHQTAPAIEELGHHPEWTNVYNRVTVRLTTHDAGHTVTPKDWELARVLDEHFAHHQPM